MTDIEAARIATAANDNADEARLWPAILIGLLLEAPFLVLVATLIVVAMS